MYLISEEVGFTDSVQMDILGGASVIQTKTCLKVINIWGIYEN